MNSLKITRISFPDLKYFFPVIIYYRNRAENLFLFLGFINRHFFRGYENNYSPPPDRVKKLCLIIERSYYGKNFMIFRTKSTELKDIKDMIVSVFWTKTKEITNYRIWNSGNDLFLETPLAGPSPWDNNSNLFEWLFGQEVDVLSEKEIKNALVLDAAICLLFIARFKKGNEDSPFSPHRMPMDIFKLIVMMI